MCVPATCMVQPEWKLKRALQSGWNVDQLEGLFAAGRHVLQAHLHIRERTTQRLQTRTYRYCRLLQCKTACQIVYKQFNIHAHHSTVHVVVTMHLLMQMVTARYD